MRRYWVEKILINDKQEIALKGDAFHHIFVVCRTQKDQVFEILGAKENVALVVKTLDVGNKLAVVKIIDERQIAKRKSPHIHLHLSIPKISTFEAVLEKAVEMGVVSIELFSSDYSFIKDKNHKSLQKAERWKRIILSATQQTGRADLLQIEPIVSLEQSLKNFNQRADAMGLFAYEGDASLQWKTALKSAKEKSLKEVHCYIGSEGGFSKQEVALFEQYGMNAMTMGDQILRVETACVALVSSIKYEFEI